MTMLHIASLHTYRFRKESFWYDHDQIQSGRWMRCDRSSWLVIWPFPSQQSQSFQLQQGNSLHSH